MTKIFLEPANAEIVRPAFSQDIIELKENTKNPKFADDCNKFLASIIEKDELIEFCTSKHSWDIGEGRAGFRLIRSGVIQLELIVRMN